MLLAAGTLVVSWVLQRLLARALRVMRLREGSVRAAQRLIHYVVLTLGFGLALQALGISIAMLFAAGAIFAIGVGFAMQNIAQNFVSGIILLLERWIKPGDVLEVEGRFVRVEEMGINEAIWLAFKQAGIVIAFPQLDLHLDRELIDGLGRARSTP